MAPTLKHLTIENLTDNVNAVNAHGPDPRIRFLFQKPITYVHDFARETRLSTKEWNIGLEFLIECGRWCTDVRHEMILLSDVLGLSVLVDAIDHPKPPNCTEGTLLGPFHTHEAEVMSNGSIISHDEKGKPLLVVCTLKDTKGNPIEGCQVDIWETDSTGHYDVQHADRDGPDERCIMMSDEKGKFWFKGIVPVPYPEPNDGPVGNMLRSLRRHTYRPAHMYFRFEKKGFDHMITALFLKGDPYETTDSVFGVKDSLLVDLGTVSKDMAKEYGVDASIALVTYDFVLLSEVDASQVRDETSLKFLEKMGVRAKIVDGLPVPDVD